MDISVGNIQIIEAIKKLAITVNFSQAMEDDCTQSADVTICLPYEDRAALGEIQSAAIDSAFEFLKNVLAARS